LKPVGFGYAKSLVDEFAEAESPACSAALAGVTSIIECPDQFPAISLKDLLQLLTAAPGPGCVKSPVDAMILRVNRQLGAMDVRLRRGD
jgi:hypothetical protein